MVKFGNSCEDEVMLYAVHQKYGDEKSTGDERNGNLEVL